MIRAALVITLLALAASALADRCEAPVKGYKPGQKIVGQIRYASDGDSLCVGTSPDPSPWVEIREARWFVPELNEPSGR